MSQYNVTRDIRKLAEEAERSNTQNPSIQDMSVAGLGLGSAYYGVQTGAPKNKGKLTPLQQQIAENDARNRQNARNQGRQKNSTPQPQTKPQPNPNPNSANPKPNPQSEIKYKKDGSLDMRHKANRDAINELENLGKNKNRVPPSPDGGSVSSQTADPLKNQSKRTPRPRPEPTGLRGALTKTAEGVVDLGKNVGKTLQTPVGEISKKSIGKALPIPGIGGFGIGQLITDYTGLDEAIAGAVNIDQGMQDYFSEVGRDKSRRIGLHKLADATHDVFNFATKASGDVLEFVPQLFGAGYDALTKQPGEANLNPFTRTFRGETYKEFFDDVSASGAGMYARRPNPEMNQEVLQPNNEIEQRIPLPQPKDELGTRVPGMDLNNRSPLEQQIIRNAQGGQPLLAGTFENQEINQGFGGEGVPTYQANFLQRKQQEEPITDAEFQRAQQFALKKGMVFDPETGYSKADFFGQMFKGQTIGQFLRGEDAPEGFTDVIPEFRVGLSPEESKKAYDKASKEREERLANKPDFVDGVRKVTKREIGRDREMIEDEFGNMSEAYIPQRITEIMLKPASKRTDKENKRLASWANSTQGKGMGGLSAVQKQIEGEQEMTPYQRATLERSDRSADLAERKFQQSVKEYEEGLEKGLEADQLANMYKRVQILGLMNDLIPEQDELGFDLEPDVINDYIGVLDEFGVEYDPETNIYKRKGKFGFGKQLTKEELAELSPLLEETKFVKLLEYTSKNNQ